MDLSVILNPPAQSPCPGGLGETTWVSRLHSLYPEATRSTRRGHSSEIHKRQHLVNGCLGQSPSVLKVSNNHGFRSPSSSPATTSDLHRDNYKNQIHEQTIFNRVCQPISITKPPPPVSLFKEPRYHSQGTPSHLQDTSDPHSNTMVLPHCSSLETLASVATARKPSRIHPGSSDMFANVPLEGTHSFSAASDCPSRNGKGRPRNASIQEAHCQRAKPNVSNLTITGHSRSPSDVGGVAMAEDSKIDANGITDEGPSCSYTAGCSTGSPLRKVVSHIFGRNKLCTRQIPKGVWVHYCRKHYQRSRYRNPSGFALLQCDLVRKQIDRLDTWGGVSDWVIKVRKREELRLNKENAELAAGRTAEDAASDGDETTEMASDEMQSTPTRRSGDVCTPVESHPSNPRRTSAATVSLSSSRWLIKFTGSGKTTEEVLEVLDNIESEIRDTRCNFPDIEILPNVSTPSHGTGSDHQRSLSSWSSSSLSSSAYPDDNGDHYEPQGSKRTSTLPCERAYPVGNSSKRRTLQRGLRPSSSEQDDE